MRKVVATRYVTALREGGSLPGLVEADDDGLYVVKFRGSGQGPRALIAELIAGEVARALGLKVPELVLVDLDPRIAAAEPDPEIQDLLRASAGINIGLDFLPGSLPYNPLEAVPAELAADVVWFDALVLNVDRTARNPNLLRWHDELWLIDHGASFYRHHRADEPGWDVMSAALEPFPEISEHVLLGAAAPLRSVDERLASRLDATTLERIGQVVPVEWGEAGPYVDFLSARLRAPRGFVDEVDRERDVTR